MAGSGPDTLTDEGPPYFCVNHPGTETLVRCSKCLDPICQDCAVPTPVGLRCRSCAYANRSPLYVVQPKHVLAGTAVGLALSVLAGAFAVQLWILWAALLAGPVGGGIAEAILRVTRGKRGRAMQVVAVACIVAGSVAGPLLWAAVRAGSLAAMRVGLVQILAILLNLRTLAFAVLASFAAVVRLR